MSLKRTSHVRSPFRLDSSATGTGHRSSCVFFLIILLRNKDPLTNYFNSGMGLIHSHVLHFGIQESVICPIANGHQQSLPKSELSAYEPVLKCTKVGFRLGCSSYFGAGLVSWFQHIDGQNFTQLHKLEWDDIEKPWRNQYSTLWLFNG
jgi:hypothetical protein